MEDVIKRMKIRPLNNTAQRLTMSDADYFGGGLPGYVSNSQLGLINPDQDGSWIKFINGFDKGYVAAFELGSAVHGMTLEAESYKLSEYEKPGGKVGLIMETLHKWLILEKKSGTFESLLGEACAIHDYYSSSLTQKRLDTLVLKGKDYFEYLKGNYVPGLIVLDKNQRAKCIGCLDSLNTHSEAMNLIHPDNSLFDVKSFNEDVIVLDIEVDIHNEYENLIATQVIQLKAKMDNWTIDLDANKLILNDLKTTGKDVDWFMGKTVPSYVQDPNSNKVQMVFLEGSFQKYHYHRQMAMYAWMLFIYCKKEYGVTSDWIQNANMICVETNEPFTTMVHKVNVDYIKKGFAEFEYLIKMVAYYRQFGYQDEIPDFSQQLFQI